MQQSFCQSWNHCNCSKKAFNFNQNLSSCDFSLRSMDDRYIPRSALNRYQYCFHSRSTNTRYLVSKIPSECKKLHKLYEQNVIQLQELAFHLTAHTVCIFRLCVTKIWIPNWFQTGGICLLILARVASFNVVVLSVPNALHQNIAAHTLSLSRYSANSFVKSTLVNV